MTTARSRRALPAISVVAAGMIAIAACGTAAPTAASTQTSVPATATGGGGQGMGGSGGGQGMSGSGGGQGMSGSGSGSGQGMGGYTLSGSTCTPAAPKVSGAVVHVVLADMGMSRMVGGTAPMGARMMLRATPSTVTAGTVTLQASDRGWRTHELVVLPLAAGAKVGQRVPGASGKVSETGSLGEASAACAAGAGNGIPAGSASWITLKLPAGRYELVCNLPNHYADGMRQELDVTK